MERVGVNSSNIWSIGYDFESSTLEIEFKGGAVYQYQGVPQHEYEALLSAGSKGSYFHANIRSRFSSVKL